MGTSFFSTTIWLNVTSIFAIIILTFIYIGTRPIWCYVDTGLYTLIFNLVQNGTWDSLKSVESEPFWEFIEYTCIELTTASGWLFVIASFYILGMSIAAYRWFPRHFLLATIFLFTAFSFWGYATNGIRNGMATSIAMLGLSFFCRSKKELITGYLLLIIATFTHKSCMLIIVAATGALFLKHTKVNISIWLICIVLGILFQEQFKSLISYTTDDFRLEYYKNISVTSENSSKIGFRWDFLIYSALPIIIGWIATAKQKITDKSYLFLLHTYIFANSFWVLINTIAYSNRFAYLSWFIYPIIILYPFCKFNFIRNQAIILAVLLIIMVLFTYFI